MTEGQKDRRQKTEEQKQVERGTGKRARGPEKARKLSPEAPEQPYRALGAMLQLSCSIVTGLLEKVYGGGGNYAETHGAMPFGKCCC